MDAKTAGWLLWRAVLSWREDNASLLAAGLSYYAVFSLLPLTMLAIAIAGFALGDEAAAGLVSAQLQGLVVPEVAEAIEGLLRDARQSDLGAATVVSVVLLFWGASNVFLQLQMALNVIWGVQDRRGGKSFLDEVRAHLVKRVVSFGMVIVIGVLLLLSFLANTAMAFVRQHLNDLTGFLGNLMLWEFLGLVVSFVLLTLMTAFIYQFLPDTDIPWSDVWIGAVITSLLLAIGRSLIGLYFSLWNVGSVYGVAGSFVVLLVGVFLSVQIFLFGAEFTWEYSRCCGSKAKRPFPQLREPGG